MDCLWIDPRSVAWELDVVVVDAPWLCAIPAWEEEITWLLSKLCMPRPVWPSDVTDGLGDDI